MVDFSTIFLLIKLTKEKIMKRMLIILVMMFFIVFTVVGCSPGESTVINHASNEKNTKLTYISKFYDNNGKEWFSVEGKSFSISPNKVKEYFYGNDGVWTSGYELSSVLTIGIDDYFIESCGSTIIFADTKLKWYDVDIETTIQTDDSNNNELDSSFTTPNDLRYQDKWDLSIWWKTKQLNKKHQGSPKVVIIQSQLGTPIAMFVGNEVYWDIPKNLPKTTQITIDGKQVFVHRANFSIIDANLIK